MKRLRHLRAWVGSITIIEYMVIILIICIVLAIAIPLIYGKTTPEQRRTERRVCTVDAVTNEVISCDPRPAR